MHGIFDHIITESTSNTELHVERINLKIKSIVYKMFV